MPKAPPWSTTDGGWDQSNLPVKGVTWLVPLLPRDQRQANFAREQSKMATLNHAWRMGRWKRFEEEKSILPSPMLKRPLIIDDGEKRMSGCMWMTSSERSIDRRWLTLKRSRLYTADEERTIFAVSWMGERKRGKKGFSLSLFPLHLGRYHRILKYLFRISSQCWICSKGAAAVQYFGALRLRCRRERVSKGVDDLWLGNQHAGYDCWNGAKRMLIKVWLVLEAATAKLIANCLIITPRKRFQPLSSFLYWPDLPASIPTQFRSPQCWK